MTPAQVGSEEPAQEVMPLNFYHDGILVSGELWGLWHHTFPRASVHAMFEDVKRDIDDECMEFTRSLAWRRPLPF